LKRILIIQTAFIGDVILATSLIETISESRREACEIDIVVRKGNESLFSNHPKVNSVFVWNKKEHKYRELVRLIKQLRKVEYDFVYNLQRFATTGFMTWRLKSKLKVGYSKNPFSFCFDRKVAHDITNGKHEIDRNFELVRPDLPEETKLLKPKLYPSQEDYQKVLEKANHPGSYTVLAPASVWFTKQLPRHKWIELIRLLAPSGTIYLIGAPSDRVFLDEMIVESGVGTVFNLAGELNLLQSAALIDKARRTYVNDSAPLHLASAMNAPVTAFFCSTVPSFGFGPLSEDSILAEIEEKLDCRPCGLHGYKTCPKGHFKCGERIQISPLV